MQPIQRTPLEQLTLGIRGIVPLGPTGHLLQMATVSRLGDVADVPKTQKHREAVKMRRQTCPE